MKVSGGNPFSRLQTSPTPFGCSLKYAAPTRSNLAFTARAAAREVAASTSRGSARDARSMTWSSARWRSHPSLPCLLIAGTRTSSIHSVAACLAAVRAWPPPAGASAAERLVGIALVAVIAVVSVISVIHVIPVISVVISAILVVVRDAGSVVGVAVTGSVGPSPAQLAAWSSWGACGSSGRPARPRAGPVARSRALPAISVGSPSPEPKSAHNARSALAAACDATVARSSTVWLPNACDSKAASWMFFLV
mmetsp:Transcript_15611/g.44477  ORF Transcript_15611/g.44477 Transcript_15611/m.44477 type:complete len:251 (-) Transcript_15611:1305-2057(-)